MIDTIQFGSKEIEYQIAFVDRKSLGITVTPDMEVLVKAPKDTEIAKIRSKIRKRAPWIIKQFSHFLTFHPKLVKRRYISGETHLYLGRQYLLKVTLSDENKVKYKGRYLEVFTDDKAKAKNLLLQWYRARATIKFLEVSQPLIQKFKQYGVAPSSIQLRDMPTRWGSCTPQGKIILNPELIKAPKACIEYVIVHELCHLLHPNHTQSFFDLQTKVMPDWQKWKRRLECLLA